MSRIGWALVLLAGLTTGLSGQEVESVYAPPEPAREDEGINEGGVNFRFDFAYMTDYIWRGIERSESGGVGGFTKPSV